MFESKEFEINILHIAPAYQAKGGGIFEVVENLSSSQCKDQKNSVDIVCLDTFKASTSQNKQVYNILPSKITQFFATYELIKFMATQLKGYDFIHIHGAWSFQLFFVSLFIQSHKETIFYQPHGLLCPIRVRKSWFIKKLAWQIYQKSFLKNCKNIICCSNKEAKELSCISEDPCKIKMIPNGLDGEFFRPINNFTKRLNRFMFFSQVIPIKNLESVFYAIAELKNKDSHEIFLDIYGYGDSSYIAKLKDLILTLSISKNISFKGPVKRSERVAVYDRYTYFILPSLSENFAIVVLEALSRGCKAFVSTETPWVDFNHENLILMDLNRNSIYSSLKSHLISKYNVNDFDYKAITNLKEFEWDSISHQLGKVYCSID